MSRSVRVIWYIADSTRQAAPVVLTIRQNFGEVSSTQCDCAVSRILRCSHHSLCFWKYFNIFLILLSKARSRINHHIIIIIMAMKCALYSSETKGSIKYVHDLNILNSWGLKLKVILYQVLAWNTVIKYPATMLIPWVFILYQNKKKQGRSLLKLCKLRSQFEIHDMSIYSMSIISLITLLSPIPQIMNCYCVCGAIIHSTSEFDPGSVSEFPDLPQLHLRIANPQFVNVSSLFILETNNLSTHSFCNRIIW